MHRSILVATALLASVVPFTSGQPVTADSTPRSTVTPSCDLLVTVDGARNGLRKIDTAGKATEVRLGDYPFDVVASSDGRFAYVSLYAEGSLQIVDLSTMTRVASIPVGNGPNGIEISADDRKVYVAVAGAISVVDTTSRRLERTITLPNTPYDLVLSPDANFVYASLVLEDRVVRIDLATNSSTFVKLPDDPRLMSISPDGTRVFVAHEAADQISRIDTATMTATSIAAGDTPRGIDMSPDGSTLYVVNQGDETLSLIDTSSLARRSIAVGDGAYDVTLDANGRRAYVNNYWNDDVSVIDTSSSTVIGTISLGNGSEPWNIETVCRPPTPFTRPGAITDLFVFANFFCGPCTDAWVLFTRPAGATDFEVFLNGRRVTCAQKGSFFSLALCQLRPLSPGTAMTLGVIPMNGTIRGSAASTSLTLRP